MEKAFLILNTSCRRLLIDTSTIVRVEASSNYCKIYFSNGEKLVTAKVLKWFVENLPEQCFVRMHRSHLVNHRFLKPNQFLEKGCVLENGEFIQISRRMRKNVLNQLLAA